MTFSMKNIRHYVLATAGVAAVWFGMTIPMVVGAVGLSLDLGQAYLVRQRLSHALDAAALAAAASASDDIRVIEEKVQDFIDANYPPDRIGFTTDIDVISNADTLYVTANAQLNTSFMRIFGKDTVEVTASAEVTKEIKAIEVVLVMDVTGSMGTRSGGKTRIDSLKDAARLFVNTMFDRVKDEDMIKIGLVPFSGSVNVGRYGLGRYPDGTYYNDAFISNPRNIDYFYAAPGTNPSNANKRKWWGCVLEGSYPDDIEDHEGPWSMYRYCRRSNNDSVVCQSSTANNDANIGCPRVSVTPLTNRKNDLLSSINGLEASGNTYINIGLVWGHRLISPEFPFEEGVEWDDEDWQKAVVLMTDGVNEHHPYYSAYGLSSEAGINNTMLNNRMIQICNELRQKRVLVYTITFDKGVNAQTKNLFRQCATQESMWHDAPDDAKLREVYLTIARELANLHLSK